MGKLPFKPFVPANIQNLAPYPPGKPIDETKREYGVDEVIKLASNENPFGPSPLALKAIQNALTHLNLYPDGAHFELKQALAKFLGISVKEIAIGNGSNEFIDLVMRVFASRSTDEVLTHSQAFVAYKLCTALVGAKFKEVALKSDLRLDVDQFIAAITEQTRIVILPNPNNPSGILISKQDVEKICQATLDKKTLLVLDYAYFEYVDSELIHNPTELHQKYPHLLIFRTFSKAYGLAGLRVGYVMAQEEVISNLERSRQPFNVNSLALCAAEAALKDTSHLEKSKRLNRESREQISKECQKLGFSVFPSQTNFVLVDIKKPFAGYYEEFLKRGVILRPVANYGLPSMVRISCGTSEENQKFFKAMSEIFKG